MSKKVLGCSIGHTKRFFGKIIQYYFSTSIKSVFGINSKNLFQQHTDVVNKILIFRKSILEFLLVRVSCVLVFFYHPLHISIGHVSSVFSVTSVSLLWFLCISFRTLIFLLSTLELLIFLSLSSDGLLKFLSICIFKFIFLVYFVHTGYTHVGPQF